MKIAFLVQGLFEKSDSIGFDCVYEYERVRALFPQFANQIHIFAERFEAERYPDVPIEDLDAFYAWCRANPDGTVIYHYCGAWEKMDTFLVNLPATSVVRWHNNTSPWFYFSKKRYLAHTIVGFENIIRIATKPNLFFWVNSVFTRDQFVALGGQASRSAVVFPASRYLGKTADVQSPERRFAPDGTINMLFVGRVVPHKGHKSIVSLADRVRLITGKPVIVHFAGREDDVKAEIEVHATRYPDIEVNFYGEVSNAELDKLYQISDVFLCLSEHEGFGLPVFEAMRCGLPTIVWSTTALRELMVDHPLGFQHYDLNMFAGAIFALQDEEVYRCVLAAQQRVLESYTAQILDGQLLDALAAVKGDTDTRLHTVLPPALQSQPEIAHAVLEQMQKAQSVPKKFPLVDRDSGYNLFSRYDIQTFRKFFDRSERLRFAAFENFKNNGQYRIEAREFHHREGKFVEDVLYFKPGPYSAGHLIFGPYKDLPIGNFTVMFDVSVTSSDLKSVVFDVSSQKHGDLNHVRTPLAKLSKGMPTLRFRCDDENDIFEFRVKFESDFEGEVTFRGVILSQI
ncbi:glycosyltransferase family 4 protein [Novacetimonas pomaceti]|uniref:glycosyltransferase family 4 protein n=1 Tax=Novacetimonas pomaceti TaxID=2021998 RepID=UPI001C2CC699|nr:glycosyltransferase family 4 protein [Novacetimonas pomaceti]MBV1833568.1 glycosyltransferase family 4 protein [Novacetimonas pomaceti]